MKSAWQWVIMSQGNGKFQRKPEHLPDCRVLGVIDLDTNVPANGKACRTVSSLLFK